MKRIYSTLLILICCLSSVDAQSLAKCIEIARANNMGVKVADLQVQRARRMEGSYFEMERTGKNSGKISKIVIDLGTVNRMGIDALEKYIELILGNEKYTSLDAEFLKKVWGVETYYHFYEEERDLQ